MRVLVAEDDAALKSVLERGLREAGYVVDAVTNGNEAMEYLRAYEYGVGVLDWRMPGASGFEVITWARRRGIHTPFLMLTARDAPLDRIAALDEGADDYLVKPFDYGELLARLRALLRRPSGDRSPLLRCGSLTVDPATRQALVDGVSVELTPREFAIVELLIRKSPALVHRQTIALQAWPEEADAVGSNTIDVHIARLRAKLARSDARIETLPRLRLSAGGLMMRRIRPTEQSGNPVRLHARRVALGATVFALVIYLVACSVADLLVVDRLYGSLDGRLAVRLGALAKEFPHGVSTVTPLKTQVPSGGDDDLDDAPILAWFVPSGQKSVQRLDAGSPVLPASDLHVDQPIDAYFGGRSFRLDGMAVTNGRIVVATSTQDVGSIRATLLLIEGILAPIVLLSLFIAATIIGRRAAAPIERARRRQLEFTADASHELRTPLSVIEAEVGLALNSNRTAASYRSALERVSGESKRLRRIVDDLLWLARLDSLPANPPHEAVDLASLVRSCAERFDAIAAQKHLTIAVLDGASPPPLVLAPAEWLDRLVSVLLDNACRYTNTGGRVEIAVSSSTARVTLIVDDSGPGIAEDEREHIAQRFHRASTAPGGAGLGLSIADAVVRATNGEWRVATAPLSGARIEASWTRFQADDGYDESSDDARARARPSEPVNAS